jgi:hypothetical protein
MFDIADLNDQTERTVCSTVCVECGKEVDWPNAHLAYPLCPDCDCCDNLKSIPPDSRPTTIQPSRIVTLTPNY